MLRKTIAILCAVFVLLALVGCGKKDNKGQGANVEIVGEEFVPADIKFDSEFVILVSGYVGGSNFDFEEFNSIDETSTVLETAVYKRIAAVEDLYGIDIVTEEDMGSNTKAFEKINSAYLSGESPF